MQAHLQFVFIKNAEQVVGDESVKADEEVVHLIFEAGG